MKLRRSDIKPKMSDKFESEIEAEVEFAKNVAGFTNGEVRKQSNGKDDRFALEIPGFEDLEFEDGWTKETDDLPTANGVRKAAEDLTDDYVVMSSASVQDGILKCYFKVDWESVEDTEDEDETMTQEDDSPEGAEDEEESNEAPSFEMALEAVKEKIAQELSASASVRMQRNQNGSKGDICVVSDKTEGREGYTTEIGRPDTGWLTDEEYGFVEAVRQIRSPKGGFFKFSSASEGDEGTRIYFKAWEDRQ